jgi:hypothetical protein
MALGPLLRAGQLQLEVAAKQWLFTHPAQHATTQYIRKIMRRVRYLPLELLAAPLLARHIKVPRPAQCMDFSCDVKNAH